jgi:hypothetical protein
MTTPTQTKLQTLKSATRTMLIEDDHFQSVMASAYQWDGLRLAGLDPEKTQAAKDALRAVVNAAASALHAEFTDQNLQRSRSTLQPTTHFRRHNHQQGRAGAKPAQPASGCIHGGTHHQPRTPP